MNFKVGDIVHCSKNLGHRSVPLRRQRRRYVITAIPPTDGGLLLHVALCNKDGSPDKRSAWAYSIPAEWVELPPDPTIEAVLTEPRWLSFQAMLDDNIEDSNTRLVLSDWLEEQGHPWAAGYRWMGDNQRWPQPWELVVGGQVDYNWWSSKSNVEHDATGFIPALLFQQIQCTRAATGSNFPPLWKAEWTRLEAELALCWAIAEHGVPTTPLDAI